MRKEIKSALKEIVTKELNVREEIEIKLEKPARKEHGDIATNVAFLLAPHLKRSPKSIAKDLVPLLEKRLFKIERIEVAGPGFINFFIGKENWLGVLREIHEKKDLYGCKDIGKGKKVQIEFVSANPTGPLHIGHARGAVLGDVLANIMDRMGYRVDREYYVNDQGRQMKILGRSVYLRYLNLLGKEVELPPDHYQGDYIIELAKTILDEHGDRFLGQPEEKVIPYFSEFASNRIIDSIKEDLALFGVHFDQFFSEKSLYESDRFKNSLKILREKELLYEKDGAFWFKSSMFGDEKDRVVIRSDGTPTYFASDIAYHQDKILRGYDFLIDIWGADHHGYVARLKAVIKGLGYDESKFHVILVQLVRLMRKGKVVPMSTRAGEFITLREVLDEVGRDAMRFIFLTRKADSPLDFDIEVAKAQTEENPVFYVQYAHARICSIKEKAKLEGMDLSRLENADLERIELEEEIDLIKWLANYPIVLESALDSLEPHRLTHYLHQLAGEFHRYYNHHRVISDDMDLSYARLYLVEAVRRVIFNGLTILGVNAPKKM